MRSLPFVTTLPRWFLFLLLIVSWPACRRPPAPASLPKPVKAQFDWSRGPDAAFVWTVPDVDQGVTDRAPKWKTHLMTRSGGLWAPAGVRDGLWLAVGDRLLEVTRIPFQLEAMEPPQSDDPGYAGWPEGCEHVLAETDRMFSASGNGFDLKPDGADGGRPLLDRPADLSGLGWPRIYRAHARVLASLGSILFLISDDLTVTCEGNQFRSAIFTVFDASTMQVLLARNIETLGSHPWDAHFDRTHHRNRIRHQIEWAGSAGGRSVDKPEDGRIHLGYYYPVFHSDDLRVNMKLVFHYDEPCRTCEKPEALATLTIDWPGDLVPLLRIHPAIPALRPHLARGERIGGVTLPSVSGPILDAWTARFRAPRQEPVGKNPRGSPL
ncbi:hypothetical protein KJ975_06510 [Myxococcota bacterium]|nr:hypothetical protein [Myxococcota bacterium]